MLQTVTQPKSLAGRVDKHLLACAAAAAAIGAFGTEQAEAVINYSGTLNFAVNPATAAGVYVNVQTFGIATAAATDVNWNLNIFNILYTGFQTGVAFYPNLATHPGNTDRVIGNGVNVGWVNKLAANTVIGPASPLMTLNGNSIGAHQVFSSTGSSYGLPWPADGSTGFMGFKVDFGGGSHFGWMRIKIDPWQAGLFVPPIPPFPVGTPNQGAAPITIVDFAWESQFNTAIQAGAIPEPTTAAALGLLALGAAGIRPRRMA